MSEPTWPTDVEALRAIIATQEAELQLLRREIAKAADYGLGRDGCPFCGGVAEHRDCIYGLPLADHSDVRSAVNPDAPEAPEPDFVLGSGGDGRSRTGE